MPETPSPDPAARSSTDAQSLEARLKAAREAKGLSLTDVQQETRIPADVLQRLEEGRLLGDASFNPVYLKALLRSYAAAVGLNSDEILASFDPGSHRLVADPPHAVAIGTSPSPPPDPIADAASQRGRPDSGREPATSEARAASTSSERARAAPAAGAGPSVEEPATRSAPEGSTRSASVAGSGPGMTEPSTPAGPTAASALAGATDVAAPSTQAPQSALVSATGKHRVMTAEQARTPRAFDRSWGLIIGGTIGIALIFGGLLWLLFRDRTPAPEPRPRPVAADTAARPDTAALEPTAPAPAAGPTLAMPIRVTVTAGPGGLQNFRVTTEPDARLGHWIEEGASMTFESPTAVVLWGEGAEGLDGGAALELQGIRWTPDHGRVLRIDAESGQRLLDSLTANG